MQNTDQSSIVGVFRDHAKADRAVEELKQAGFREDQITSSVYSQQPAQEAQAPDTSRIVITVNAEEGKAKQAFGILFNNGSNNADLLPGMTLSDGKIVSSVDLSPESNLEAGFSKDSYFGYAAPGISEEPVMGDNH